MPEAMLPLRREGIPDGPGGGLTGGRIDYRTEETDGVVIPAKHWVQLIGGKSASISVLPVVA